MDNIAELLTKKEKLNPELKKHLCTHAGMKCLKHPLLFSVPYFPGMEALLNAQFKARKSMTAKALNQKDYEHYIWLHERPYRINAFMEVATKLTTKQYWQTLREIIIDTESSWQHKTLVINILTRTGDIASRALMMTALESKKVSGLPEIVNIYRGCGNKNKDGYSWTLSENIARWFATRFNKKDAYLLSGHCTRKSIIAYFESRGEDEIIIDPNHVVVLKEEKL